MRYRESHKDQGGKTGGRGRGVTHRPSVFHVPGTIVGALCAVHQLDEITCPSHITSKQVESLDLHPDLFLQFLPPPHAVNFYQCLQQGV